MLALVTLRYIFGMAPDFTPCRIVAARCACVVLLLACGLESIDVVASKTRAQAAARGANLSVDAIMTRTDADLPISRHANTGVDSGSQIASWNYKTSSKLGSNDWTALRLASVVPEEKANDEAAVQPKLPYESFIAEFGMPSERGVNAPHVSAVEREMLFNSRLIAVQTHNSQSPRRPWVAAINKFADLTDSERRAHLGYTRAASPQSLRRSFVKADHSLEPQSSVLSTQTVDWRRRLKSGDFVREQGSCGSCWAIAAAGALETHLELLSNTTTKVSAMELVECVPNPQQCGGSGGCEGATAELAFDYASSSGVQTMAGGSDSLSRTCIHSTNRPSSVAVARGFVQLPTNQLRPLLQALTQGPVAVSVAAGPWYTYGTGVFDGCDRDAVVDHAVLAMGYGSDPSTGLNYYSIRNSWGRVWGEGGYMRILRHGADNDYCGIDNNPQAGYGCLCGPSEVRVCGMCGILSDSSYPVGVRISEPAKKAARGFLKRLK